MLAHLKIMGQFFFVKRPNMGGGVRGRFGKIPDFYRVFFSSDPFPYSDMKPSFKSMKPWILQLWFRHFKLGDDGIGIFIIIMMYAGKYRISPSAWKGGRSWWLRWDRSNDHNDHPYHHFFHHFPLEYSPPHSFWSSMLTITLGVVCLQGEAS